MDRANRQTISVATTGGAGTSTGSGRTSHPLHGEIKAIVVSLDASIPTTADLTIEWSPLGEDDDWIEIFSLTNIDVSTWAATHGATRKTSIYYPLVDGHDSSGSALTADSPIPLFVNGHIRVTVAQANDADPAAVISFFVR